MPQDLLVKEGTHVLLDEQPPQSMVEALQRVKINTLQDLVNVGVVRSREALDKLIQSAQAATTSALRSRETYAPPVRVVGMARSDLRRFPAFRAAVPEVHSADADIFWRVVRDLEPTAIAHMTPASTLSWANLHLREILKYLFNDVEIYSNAVLTLAPKVQVFECRNLIIRRGGKIVIQGTGTVIKAFSIQGNV